MFPNFSSSGPQARCMLQASQLASQLVLAFDFNNVKRKQKIKKWIYGLLDYRSNKWF